ncbi:hypothetical protein B0T24DRAFT_528292 [Lasiosphaeria ovina]|uniref:Uncharacterized protein n=1 Tax=Lasiosphaeria ovina TaxID=92902 RepID=A0AAE0KDF9_9PEZI|nr:hypothetical protein B0T24DRAFT_528292 [Lasiosphaeria ovina]
MKVTIKNQENQIRQFQSLAFEGLNGGTWAAGDDTTIRAELESLQCNIKAWARKYAIDDMNSIKEIPANNYEIFLKALGNVVRLRTRKDELGCLQTSPMNKKAPTICLQALLSHRIYANIIKEPFFALGKRGRVLQSVYVDMKKANEKEAHIWRSRTIRLLSTPPATRTMGGGGGDNRQQSQDHEFALGLKDASQAVTNYFFDSPAKHLIRPSAFSPDNFSQTCSDMDSLVQQAALISFKLWSRRTALYLLGLPDLKDKSFSVVSDFMKAHPLHRLHDDDDKCNGFSVIIVTQPAVIGYGSSDGRDYSKSTERVWMKAEVLLSETAKI